VLLFYVGDNVDRQLLKNTKVSIDVSGGSPNRNITCVYPNDHSFDSNKRPTKFSWDVSIKDTGVITVDNNDYSFLFYESSTIKTYECYNLGYTESHMFGKRMNSIFKYLNWNDQSQIDTFIIFWMKQVVKHKYISISIIKPKSYDVQNALTVETNANVCTKRYIFNFIGTSRNGNGFGYKRETEKSLNILDDSELFFTHNSNQLTVLEWGAQFFYETDRIESDGYFGESQYI
jgi:hypothetical protein